MKLIDLSQPLYHDAPNCPTHPAVVSKTIADHPKDGWRMEHLTLASHTGSHLDAPLHKIAGGKSIDELRLETFVGEAFIFDLRDSQPDRAIDGATLERLAAGRKLEDRIILLATGWGDRRAKSEEWLRHSPYVSPDGARWLVQKNVRAVGIDHYSIGGSGDDNAVTHEILLGNEIWIVEELHFSPEAMQAQQPAMFWALPINFRGFSGAFCRPVLAIEESRA
jgi:kynurenine formamidase